MHEAEKAGAATSNLIALDGQARFCPFLYRCYFSCIPLSRLIPAIQYSGVIVKCLYHAIDMWVDFIFNAVSSELRWNDFKRLLTIFIIVVLITVQFLRIQITVSVFASFISSFFPSPFLLRRQNCVMFDIKDVYTSQRQWRQRHLCFFCSYSLKCWCPTMATKLNSIE